ncbi:hypothetical protein Ancab_022760 [Ancistrocladus abbreviatus]
MITMENNLTKDQLPTSKVQDGPLDPMLNTRASAANKLMMPANLGQQKLTLPNKRKASVELMPNDETLQRTSQVRSFSNPSVLFQPSVQNKRVAQMGPMSNSPRVGSSGRKAVRIESIPNRSQSFVVNNRNPQTEASAKPQTNSFDSVRSKLRESLAAALALVDQQQQNSLAVENKVPNETAITSVGLEQPKPPESTCSTSDATNPEFRESVEALPSTLSCADAECNDVKKSGEIHSKDNLQETANTWDFVGQDDSSFSDGFFIKDDLLLGNGLSWAMDIDMDAAGEKEVKPSQKPELMQEDVNAHDDANGGGKDQAPVPSSEKIAHEIESGLFKLYGGVNKKYKEKGRSLLFNLKDRNNPDLRERVISGEILPQKLCSMTAEELASKELSQWRIAKAEELAQQKVLPDSEVDVRRLVKKTHKGEFQVDFEQDIAASVEVPVSTSVLPHSRSGTNGSSAQPLNKADGTKDKVDVEVKMSNAVDHNDGCRLTIPSDGADMMQGLMVDDMKDLPPIVSLDEFMESLDKEPPFENLTASSEKAAFASENKSPNFGSEPNITGQAVKDPMVIKMHATEEVNTKSTKSNADVKPALSPREPEYPVPDLTKAERVWEGLLQLNISSLANFVAFYESGEKALTNEWPKFFEIKGRVRLDAFEKFLQELPMSKSRAIMVAHFVLAEGCTDTDRAYLQEVVDSYIVDQRLGYSEPAPGVELYFCPPHTRTLDMLGEHLPKYNGKLDAIDNGLIGIVVWRKAHLSSTISPKSSQQVKVDNAKRQLQPASRKPHEQGTKMNVNFASVPAPPIMSKPKTEEEEDEGDDDVPPGFGHQGSRDDDDLPEFSFSGGANPFIPPSSRQNVTVGEGMVGQRVAPRALSRPVEQMRELVKKYGHTDNNVSNVATGITLEAWNDDDDDIPEWQPQGPQQQAQQQPNIRSNIQLPMGNRPPMPPPLTPLAKPIQQLQPLQPPMNPLLGLQNGAPRQQGAWWSPRTPIVQPSSLGNQPTVGQFYGLSGLGATPRDADWRADGSRTRRRGV